MGSCASTGARVITQEGQRANSSTYSVRTETDSGAHKRRSSSPLKVTNDNDDLKAISSGNRNQETYLLVKDVRVIIIGNTGNGKSSLGNTLLGREAFGVGSAMGATTRTCMWDHGLIDEIQLKVTDTPGLSELSKEEILNELSKSFALSCPGPHVVILVLRCDRPFSKEEHATVMTLLDLFVDKDRRFLMIVFTGGDSLSASDDQRAKGKEDMQLALQKKLIMAPERLREVLREAGTTYCAVDNTGSFQDKKNQARKVFSMIKTLMKRNKEECFTNERWVQYNEFVQAQIKHLQDTEKLSPTDAENKVRDEVVKGSLLGDIVKIGLSYIVPVISVARGVVSSLWS